MPLFSNISSNVLKIFRISKNSPSHVIVLGCDGFGQVYLEKYIDQLPNIRYLIENGASARTHRARSRLPSISAPNWASIITGQSPEETGINSNEWTPEQLSPQTKSQLALPPVSGAGKMPDSFWKVAKEQKPNLRVGVSLSWNWVHYFVDQDVDDCFQGFSDDVVVKDNIRDVLNGKRLPNIFFVHLEGVDQAGHQYGWGSKEYETACLEMDEFVGEVLNLIQVNKYTDNTAILFTADHGGWQHHHDFFNQDSFYVPIVFYGKGIKKNYDIPYYVNNLNIAPTILELMGLKKGTYMMCEAIKGIMV